MEASGTLQVIAEIAVAFIGFAGIVGALARGQLSPEDPHSWLGFWTMIEFGLAMLLAALLPSLLFHLGTDTPSLWGFSSGVLALYLLVHLTFVTPLFIRARRGVSWPLGIVLLDVATFICLLLAFVSQTLNAFDVGFDTGIGGFLVGLYLLLMVSGLNFALLAYLLLLPEMESPNDRERDAAEPV